MTWGARTKFQYTGYLSPLPMSGLQLWFDASNLASITKNGSNQVSQWNDLSGNGHNATIVASAAVDYVTSGFSIGGVRFTSTSAMAISGCPASQTWTTFLVATWVAATSQAYLGLSITGPSPLDLQTAFYSDAGDAGTPLGSPKNEIYGSTNTGVLTTGKHQGTFQHSNGDSTTGLIRIDGSAQTMFNTGNGAEAARAFTRIGPGDQAGWPGNSQSLGEVLAYNRALSLSEIQSVESYLKAKWGTP